MSVSRRSWLMFLGMLVLGGLAAVPVPAQDQPYSGIDPDGFDKSVRPQDDLFLYVNGRWLMGTEIPADKSNYGSFTALDDTARANIRAIVEQAAAAPANDTARKVGDFYRSYMDEQRIEQLGLRPLQSELEAVDRVDSVDALVQHLGYLQSRGIDGPIGFFVSTDAKNSERHLAAVIQSGTTLPDRDYYLKDDEKYASARAALQACIIRYFQLAGFPGGDQAAQDILQLETRLAGIQWERTELRNAEKRYNLYQTARLPELTPRVAWPVFFRAAGAPELQELNVATPSYFSGLDAVLHEVPLATWQQYLRFRILDGAATWLTSAFVDAHFQLHGRALAGIPEQQPRWKRAVDAVSGAGAGDFGVLGDAVGELYVQQHFRPEAKQRMDELVANLLKTYEKSIHELTWMTDVTRQKALDKLHRMTPKIGYPVRWRDYSCLEIRADDLVGNMLRSAVCEHQRMLNKLGQPVDRNEWGMTPQTVNAYYNPSRNEIVFPAAILQPPFFDADADDAANYGGIGAVIGHEISHGFDDQGSKYDGAGNLNNWWTDADRAAFEQLTAALVRQYEAYEALPGRRLNGQLTLGENIADLSGMAIAYKAYMSTLNGGPGTVIDGHTPSQRFFLGWAQIWRRKYRDEEMLRRLVTDPHSPSAFRANGPVVNLDAFYEAFDVQPGDRLYRPKSERIQIW